MVSFVCNHCQQTLKKPKLDLHTYSCRNANFTCIDCNTDFYGTEYRGHTSCISEAQKYQKSLYKGNKNAAKPKLSKEGNSEPKSQVKESEASDKKRPLDSATLNQIKKHNSDNKVEPKPEIHVEGSKPDTKDLKLIITKVTKEILAEKPKMKFSKLKTKVEKKVKKNIGNIAKEDLLSAVENHVIEALKNDELALSILK